jgi:hypothetical protein
LPRNAVRLPDLFNNDLAFFKNIPIGEKRNIRLRWEIYNIFNRANFRDIEGELNYGLILNQSNPAVACTRASAPTTNVCTTGFAQTRSNFGAPTSARAPRIMQASIQINF